MSVLRGWILAVGVVQVMAAAALAQDAYPLPPLVKMLIVIANAGLVLTLANLRSWNDVEPTPDR